MCIRDRIYTSLLNDINPGAIDETTQDHLKNLRDIIKSYINISVKRDRLQYIYNQDKAETIRSAVPNPLAILSTTQSLDWKRLAASVVFTVVDSYNNYKSANAAVDQEFLMSGWELEDEEKMCIRDRFTSLKLSSFSPVTWVSMELIIPENALCVLHPR